MKDQVAEGLYGTAGELEKLVAFMPEGHRVSAQDVERVRGKPPGISVFDWSEAVAQGDHGRALDIVAKNLETGEAPLRMLGAFLWQMRRIWKTKALMEEGKDPGQAARQAGIHPFQAREFVQQVQLWKEPHLRQAWELFAQADSALKGCRASRPKLILDDLVIQLCQARKTGQVNRTPPLKKSHSAQNTLIVVDYLMCLESVDAGRETGNPTGGGVSMKGTFGHGFMQFRGRLSQRNLGLIALFVLNRSMNLLNKGLDPSQD